MYGYLVASRETEVGAIRLAANDAGIMGILADSRTCTGSSIGRNCRGRSQSRDSECWKYALCLLSVMILVVSEMHCKDLLFIYT